jgi:hypothetical protein
MIVEQVLKQLYSMVMKYGVDYASDPANHPQLLRISFIVLTKIVSMVFRGGGLFKSKSAEEAHIECKCNSCKVWKAKLEQAEEKAASESASSTNGGKTKILSSLSSMLPKISIFKRKAAPSEE